jgi:hypothetical protein
MGNVEQSLVDIYNGNIDILKANFPHVIPYLPKKQVREPFVSFISYAHGRPGIYVRCADGRSRMLYKENKITELLHKIVVTAPPDPYDMVFILGIGLGEVCLKAIQRFTKKPRIVIIEPYPSLFRIALYTKALNSILKYTRLSIYLGAQANEKRIVEDYKHILPVGRTLLFIYPYPAQLTGNTFKQLEKNFIHHIRSTRDMWHTTKHFGKRMLDNALANLPSLLSGTPMRVLRNRFKRKPVICVAAGPSLDSALPLLKKMRGNLIIACDSAVGSLLNADVQPHIVATADLHNSNAKKLSPHMGFLKDTVLAFGLEANPENISTFPGSRKVGMTAYNQLVLGWIDQSLNLQCRVPSMTSVTHLAVLLSIAMGADPIILVGVDMAYLSGQSHAQGSVYSHIPENKSLIPVKAADGGIVHAPPQLVTDRLILEQIIAQHQVRIINVSMKGAMVDGTEVRELKQVIRSEVKDNHSVRQILETIAWDASPAKDVVKFRLDQLAGMTGDLEIACHQRRKDLAKISSMIDQEEEQNGFKHLYKQLKKEHLTFLKQHGSMIAIVQDAMLDEIQTALMAQEVIDSTMEELKRQTMLDELKALDAFYVATASMVNRIGHELKLIGDTYDHS